MMGANLVDFLGKYGRAVGVKGVRVMQSTARSNLAFVILRLSRPESVPHEDYRVLRRHLLELCCLGIKVRLPEVDDIVSIGLDAGNHEHRSEDLFYFDAREWDHSKNAQVNEKLLASDLFQSDIRGGRRMGGMKAYPDAPQLKIKMKSRDANRLCPCGSGKKFKRYHGVR
ncbi:SEC-C metal-binding domain-containing protein [Deinococcus sp. UYEF24]